MAPLPRGPVPRGSSSMVRAYSSVVEHCVDIAGVASSILATPTMENPAGRKIWPGFSMVADMRLPPTSKRPMNPFDAQRLAPLAPSE